MLFLSSNQFNSNGFWLTPLNSHTPTINDVDLFDQNGYDLTPIEQLYATVNQIQVYSHRSHRTALKSDWFCQEPAISGPTINHSLLFERKGYQGEALEQLKRWAKILPLLYKIIAIRPKWGMDISVDYVDNIGNSFELLHWEYDCFDYNEAVEMKTYVEPIILNIDWLDAAKYFLQNKQHWHHLDFFAQSAWKCNYFGIPQERFKMVIWQ